MTLVEVDVVDSTESKGLLTNRLSRPAWRRVVSWSLIAVTGLFLWRYAAQHSDEFEVVRQVTAATVVGLVVLQVLYLVPQAYRYELVLERQSGKAIGTWSWFRIFVVGRSLNTLLTQAGNVYRGAKLKSVFGVSVGSYVGGILAFTWLSVTWNLLLATAVTLLFESSLEFGEFPVVSLLLVAALMVAVAPFAVHGLLSATSGWRFGAVSFRRLVGDTVRASLAIPADLGFVVRFLGASMATFAIALLVVDLAFAGLGSEIGIGGVVIFVALLQVGSLLNLTPGNIGVQEVGFGFLAEGLGLGLGVGLIVSALVRVTGVIALGLTAVAAQSADGLQRRLRSISRTDD